MGKKDDEAVAVVGEAAGDERDIDQGQLRPRHRQRPQKQDQGSSDLSYVMKLVPLVSKSYR